MGTFTFLAVTCSWMVSWVFAPATEYTKQKSVIIGSKIHSTSSFDVKAKIDLSIVVPAYKEEERLPVMLERTLAFMESYSASQSITYEVIVVDDGSPDDTAGVAKRYMKKKSGGGRVRLLQLEQNVGKGGAVKRGVAASLGHLVLMADADAATEIEDLVLLHDSVKALQAQGEKRVVAIGSRAHLRDSSVQVRAWYRTVLMYGFHFAVRILCSSTVRDTQCGFKLFTRPAADVLFSALHLERWAFDVELIYLAEALGIPITEHDVRWEEVDGSKLIVTKWDVVTTSLYMARDMLCVRLSYMLGVWNYDVKT